MNQIPIAPYVPNTKEPGGIRSFFSPVIDETIEDVGAGVKNYIASNHHKWLMPALIGVFLWESLVVVLYFIFSYNLVSDFFEKLIVMALVPIILFFGYVILLTKRVRHEFYRQFALANRFLYVQSDDHFEIDGALFKIGNGGYKEDVITGTLSGCPIVLLNYHYSIGSGKSKQSFNNTVFRVRFEHLLPPILLKVDHKYFGGMTPQFPDSVKMSLEGDYDNFFDLYTQRKFEIETLQIFSQEFMRLTKEKWRQFSLEFSNKDIYVYCDKLITTKAELHLMFELVQYLVHQLQPVLQRTHSSVKAMHELRKE